MGEIITVIDISSSAIKMCIAELTGKNFKMLENLSYPIPLGKDTFRNGRLTRETINNCIEVLQDFLQVTQMFGAHKIHAYATTAVREATNRDIFVDNIHSRTGIEVEVLSPAKTAFFLSERLKTKVRKNQIASGFFLGAGRCEMLFFSKEGLLYNASLDIGFMKLNQAFRRGRYGEEFYPVFLETVIDNELRPLVSEFDKYQVQTFFGTGLELDEILNILNHRAIEKPKKGIKLKDLLNLYKETRNFSVEEIVHRLKVPYDKAEGLIAAMLISISLMRILKVSEIKPFWQPLEECILSDLIAKRDPQYYPGLVPTITSFVENIGNALSFDAQHARVVSSLALKIFDATLQIHLMGTKERNYLLAAAMLHNIGNVVASRARHKHSQYIVNAQDFPYFNDEEKSIIANIVRYNRNSTPKKTHIEFMALPYRSRMTVIKLASLLRLADSLENNHTANSRQIGFEHGEGYLNMIVDYAEEPFSILNAFNSRKDLFEDFFGIKLQLIIERTIK
ncbi:MAG: HD domain-containing protein [Candidatus Riflebacteria bacterium]